MGCGKPSRIVSTTPTTATISDPKPSSPVAAPRPASISREPCSTAPINPKRRSSIPIKATSPRAPIPGNIATQRTQSTRNIHLKEKTQTPPETPKGSRPASRVSSNGHVREAVSPTGPRSTREIKVQKRVSRGSVDIKTTRDRSRNLLQERDMNGGNTTGDNSNNSSLSTRSNKPLLASSRKAVPPARNVQSIDSSLPKPTSVEVVVVVDPEVEGKTRIPRPRQTSQHVDPRRYIRLVYSYEDLRESTRVKGRSVSAVVPQQKIKRASTTPVVWGQQQSSVNSQAMLSRPQAKARPQSVMVMGSSETKGVEGRAGGWTGRVLGEPVKA